MTDAWNLRFNSNEQPDTCISIAVSGLVSAHALNSVDYRGRGGIGKGHQLLLAAHLLSDPFRREGKS